MNAPRILWYFADPMCSWCWGFAPVIRRIKETYGEQLQLALVMGGLRAGNTEPLTAERRAETLAHWREVENRCGQTFRYEGALPDGFVYDTEPACRAVVCMEELQPEAKFDYFIAVQHAFYREARDVTAPEVLASLAQAHGVAKAEFLARFATEEIIKRTFTHFGQTYQAGIRGFPAAVLQQAGSFKLLTYGYARYEELAPALDAWLADHH